MAVSTAILLIVHLRASGNGGRWRLVAVVLAAVSLRAVVPWGAKAAGLLNFPLLAATGLLVAAASGGLDRRAALLWPVAAGGAALAIASVILLGHWGTLPFRLLYGFTFGSLPVYAVIRLARSRVGHGHGDTFVSGSEQPGAALCAAAAGALLAACVLEVLLPGVPAIGFSTPWGALVLLGVCVYRLARYGCLAEAGYPPRGWRPGSAAPELIAARVRLAETENSLFVLDRLAACGLLATGAAHEFKGILSGIFVSAQFGLKGSSPARAREALRRVLEHARQAELAVHRQLDPIARYGREEPRTVDLARDLGGVFGLLRGTCSRRGVSLAVQIDEGLVVQARPGELSQVLLNLVRNALESLESGTPAGAGRGGVVPELTIRGRLCEGEALFEVSDNGPGVAAARVADLFELAVSGAGSTGLGLYLSRLLVERNGGTLEYVPEEGGCFRLVLPVALQP